MPLAYPPRPASLSTVRRARSAAPITVSAERPPDGNWGCWPGRPLVRARDEHPIAGQDLLVRGFIQALRILQARKGVQGAGDPLRVGGTLLPDPVPYGAEPVRR